MKEHFKYSVILISITFLFIVSCGKDEISNILQPKSEYGILEDQLIATGQAKDITYTTSIILGSIAIEQLINSDFTIGVIYMPQSSDENFNYDENFVYNTSKHKTTNAIGNKFNIIIDGLQPSTKYYYRTYVKLGSNFIYGKVYSFITSDVSELFNISLSEDVTNTFFLAKITGTCDFSGLVNNGIKFTSGILCSRYADSKNILDEEYLKNNKITFIKSEASSNNDFNVTLTNLVPNSRYFYRAYVQINGKNIYADEIKAFDTYGTDRLNLNLNISKTIPTMVELSTSYDENQIVSNGIKTGCLYSYEISDSLSFYYAKRHKTDIKNYDFKSNKTILLKNLQDNCEFNCRSYIAYKPSDQKDSVYIYSDIKKIKIPPITITTTGFVNLGVSKMWEARDHESNGPEFRGKSYTYYNACGLGSLPPTKYEAQELETKCSITNYIYNNVDGVAVTGTTGNSIFFQTYTSHWTRSGTGSNVTKDYSLYYKFNRNLYSNEPYIFIDGTNQNNGLPVRLVK